MKEDISKNEIRILVRLAKVLVNYHSILKDDHPFNRNIDEIETIGELREFVDKVYNKAKIR